MGSKTNSQHRALLHFCGHIFNTYSMLNGESVQYALTTQISACLQEQVGLMSISSWTLSFSSSPRTWLNFFMKSWAFPASGRFSVNIKQSSIRMSVTWSGMNPNYFEEMCGLKKKKLCGLKLTGNTHQLPKHGCVIGLGLPGERGRNVRYVGTLASKGKRLVLFVCPISPLAACGGPAALWRGLWACSDTSTSHSGPWQQRSITPRQKRNRREERWQKTQGTINILSLWHVLVDLLVRCLSSCCTCCDVCLLTYIKSHRSVFMCTIHNCACLILLRGVNIAGLLTWQHLCPGRRTGSTDTSSSPLCQDCEGPCTERRSSLLITCRKEGRVHKWNYVKIKKMEQVVSLY